MAKKTRWFPCSIKPVRNGWYECSFLGYGGYRFVEGGIAMRYWTGKKWMWRDPDVNYLHRVADVFGAKWRGLSK